MFKKLPALMLCAVTGCTALYAQKTAEPAPQPARPEAPAVWSFQFEGGGSYLGVEPREVTKDNYAKLGLGGVRGVLVEKVVENSPAAKAGLQAGDVIVRFDGDEVSGVRKLTRLIAEVAPDHQVTLTILRGGAEQQLTATLEKREIPAILSGNLRTDGFPSSIELPKMPEMPAMPRVEALPPDARIFKKDGDNLYFFGSNRQIGVSVSSLTKQLGDYFGVADGRGLLVSGVREDSPAAKAGLRAGDVIVEADGKPVASNLDLVRAVNEKKDGAVRLTIVRDRSRQSVAVTPETIKGDSLRYFEETPAMPNVRVTAPAVRVAPSNTVLPRVAPLPAPRRVL